MVYIVMGLVGVRSAGEASGPYILSGPGIWTEHYTSVFRIVALAAICPLLCLCRYEMSCLGCNKTAAAASANTANSL
jgi:hypothetical protein